MIHQTISAGKIQGSQVDFDFKVPANCTRLSFLLYNKAEDVEVTGVVLWDTSFGVRPDNEQGMILSHRGLAIQPWFCLYVSPGGNGANLFGKALGYLAGNTPLCLRVFLSDKPSGGSIDIRAHWT